jgi:hypothetical protein
MSKQTSWYKESVGSDNVSMYKGAEVAPLVEPNSSKIRSQTYPAAIQALARARDVLDGPTPCQANPRGWDGIQEHEELTSTAGSVLRGHQNLTETAARVERAIEGCAVCPVLDQCDDVLKAVRSTSKPDVEGILAGDWIDSTVTGEYIDQWLKTGVFNRRPGYIPRGAGSHVKKRSASAS